MGNAPQVKVAKPAKFIINLFWAVAIFYKRNYQKIGVCIGEQIHL